MKQNQYIYNVNFKDQEQALCMLEMKALFGEIQSEKVFISTLEIDPSASVYMKNRLEILAQTDTFEGIVDYIQEVDFSANDFLVRYNPLVKEDPYIKKGKQLSKEIGLLINGFPSFQVPKEKLGVSFFENQWYFGYLHENDLNWKKHKNKPHSYSSSLGINLAKALINIAGNGDLTKKIIDPCCGVGTVLLEGLIAGYDIVGWELNYKIAENARKNIEYFNYDTQITTGNIQDVVTYYDVAIIDLPYGNFSRTDAEDQLMIIRNAHRIADKVVIVSSEDIRGLLVKERLNIIESCKVDKGVRGNFARYVWVCV